MMKNTAIFIFLILLTSGISLHAQASGYNMPPRYPVYYPNTYYQPAYIPATAAYRYPARAQYQYPRYYPGYTQRTAPPAQMPANQHKPFTQPDRVEIKQPPVVKSQLPVKKSSIKTNTDSKALKQQFIQKLLPYIEAENRNILKQRNWLMEKFSLLERGYKLTKEDAKKLETLAKKYRLKKSDFTDTETRQSLLAKIDIIPASLTLAQAANESAWGRSRFATQANNLFGIWTYDAEKGLKPKKRETGKKHFVRKFKDIGESVRYYMHMLNSHPAYAGLRKIRQKSRLDNKTIEGHQLAKGLEKYSAKGTKYIDLIVQLISQNQWALLDTPERQA